MKEDFYFIPDPYPPRFKTEQEALDYLEFLRTGKWREKPVHPAIEGDFEMVIIPVS